MKKLNELELEKIIKETVLKFKGTIDKNNFGKIISEGVHYDMQTDSFIFDFQNDSKIDIIKLQKASYQISLFT